jgi:Yip1 domain
MGSAVVGAPVPESAPLSQAARVVDTFVAPAKTFTDIRRSASWWLPFLILVVGGLAFVYTVQQKVGFLQVAENQLQMAPKQQAQVDQMPPAQREKNMDTRAAFTKYIAYGTPAIILIWDSIVALILFGTFKLAAGADDLTFNATFAVIMYASLPTIFKNLLAIVSLVAGASTDSFIIQNPVATNPGYFINPLSSRFLYGVGSALDIFTIWTLVLTAIGLSCVSKLKRSSAMWGVFGWYALVTLVGAGVGAAFS